MPNAAEQFDVVGLEALTGTATETEATARQLGLNLFLGHGQTGR